jgi:hypothetical protein
MTSLADIVANAAMGLAMASTQRKELRRFLDATCRPMTHQMDLLRSILSKNAATDFGRRHGFFGIKGLEAYRRHVPVLTYEDLKPYIDRQRQTGERCLTREMPVFYARTSGTTGDQKYIPVTASGLARLRSSQRLFALAQYRGSGLYRGKILALTSPAVEGRFDNGLPYGSATGSIYRTMPRPIRSKYVVPAPLFEVEDYEAKYYAIAALALREEGITGLAAANPSTFLKLLDVIRSNWKQLLDDLASGQSTVTTRMTAEQSNAFTRRFIADPIRARQLSALAEDDNSLTFAQIWPRLEGVVTWTGGSCGFALTALDAQWPESAKIIEAGYLSSEFWGTVNLDVAQGLCVPMIMDTFFEFVERNDWESGCPAFLTLDQVMEGQEYYIFITTPDGLFRYDINDIVEVTGRVGATPTLAFVQKGKGVTNITGEKLCESQITIAVDRTQQSGRLRIPFFVALADEERAEYQLFVEPLRQQALEAEPIAKEVDRTLRELNMEYSEKRASGRLKPLRAAWVKPGTGDLYRKGCIAQGQRDAQFKCLRLQYKRDCSFDFTSHCLAAS